MSPAAKKLLIAGGSGLLGSNLARAARDGFEVSATYNRHRVVMPGCELVNLEVDRPEQVRDLFTRTRPDFVVNTIAVVNVDYCEEHPEEAWRINVAGAENIARAAKEVGATLIHISTDSVFDGRKGHYSEKDAVGPINVYARTKAAAEGRVRSCSDDCLIVRTAFYGKGAVEGNGLAEWVETSLKEGRQIHGFTDVFFSPISARNLSQAILEMAGGGLTGTYHVAGSQRCSKYDFARQIALSLGYDPDLILPSVLSDAKLKAPRPKDISLDITKTSRVIKTPLLNVRDGLLDYQEWCRGSSK